MGGLGVLGSSSSRSSSISGNKLLVLSRSIFMSAIVGIGGRGELAAVLELEKLDLIIATLRLLHRLRRHELHHSYMRKPVTTRGHGIHIDQCGVPLREPRAVARAMWRSRRPRRSRTRALASGLRMSSARCESINILLH